ncbi:MAG: EAL domain-containing protein [Gemmatimonadales bacterium]|nr:EAL domain-containing protein [Gemmatimonadales bacterium]
MEAGKSKGEVGPAKDQTKAHADARIAGLRKELAKGNAFTEALLENLPVGIAVNTIDKGDIGYANQKYLEIYGDWTHGDFTNLDDFFKNVYRDPNEREKVRQRILLDIASGDLENMRWDDLRITCRDGTEKILAVQNIPLPEMNLMISTVQDITDQKFTEQALRESERRYQVMAESSPVGIFRLDSSGRCCHVNKRWREMAGLTLTQALGESWVVAIHPEDRVSINETWQAALQERRSYKAECRFKRTGGMTTWVFCQTEPIFDTQGNLEGFIGSVTDISRRKRTEEEVRQLAYYDTLTHLPNRSFFQEQLERALGTARRTGHHVALLFCDLDNFKDINDSLGHDKGDLLLKAIAQRLNSCIRRGDTLCRLGGDEFVLLLPTVSHDREVVSVARKIQEAMKHSFDLAGQEVFSTTSIGIAVHPEDGDNVSTLLKHADMAMYAAKGRGRNRYRFFCEDMNLRAVERMKLEVGLRQAVANDELSLAWQPQYDLRKGRLIGVEALLRWDHPVLGRIGPAKFIPLAEETGLIHEIGAWVLRTACSQARRWKDDGIDNLRLAVNLSASQFVEPGLVELVQRILKETGLDPSGLELEITESMLMQDADVALKTLNGLHQYGVKLAIDDFGTGFSSLLYLKNYPIGRIKIAREFVKDITRNTNDAAIAGTVISMARHLSMQAIAEGVETEAQAAVLRELDCPEVQGFYFARPMSAEAFGEQLH